MKEKESFKDKIDYIWYRIGSFYRSIKCYFKDNVKRKTFWYTINSYIHSYPWDYSFLYKTEEAQLKHMLQYHEHSHIVCEESRQHMIKTLKLALKMLYIIQNDTDYFEFKGEVKEIKLDKKDKNGDDLYEWDGSDLKYIQKCKVNTKNYKRFNISKNIVDLHPHELYIAKAHYLYHKIRCYYEQEWWD